MSEKLIKAILAIALFCCLYKMPYGYYQIVRFSAFIGFTFLAWLAYQRGNKVEPYIFIALALLFQPILKIALGRQLWNIIDVAVGIGLLLSIGLSTKRTENGRRS